MAYNISLLNTIKPALDESVKIILDQLDKCDSGEIQLADLNILGETQRLKSALASINKKGLETGAKVLFKAAEGLKDVDAHAWDGMQSQKIVAASKELITEIRNILDNLVNHVEIKSVFLYPYIDELNKAMGDFVAFSPDDLFEFEITDTLSKTAYSAKDLDSLKKQLKSLKPHLDKVLEDLNGNVSSIDLQSDVSKAIKTVERFQKMRHRRGYFPFWVLLKARLSLVGIVGPSDVDAGVLKEAFFEIRKFTDGQKNPSDNVLVDLVKPFIDKELEKHVYMGATAFKELDEMLSLSAWFTAKKQAVNATNMDDKKNFQLHIDEVNESLHVLEQKWNSFDDLMTNKVTGKRLEYAVSDVQKAIDGLFSVKIWLNALHMDSTFKIIAEMRPHLDDIDAAVSIEFARMLHLLGEGVRTYNQTPEFQEALDSQANRLTLAYQRQTRELDKVKVVDLGSFSKEDRLAKSMSLWAKEAKSDLKIAENVIQEWLEKDTVLDRLPALLPILSGFAGSFAGFQKNKAAEVTTWLLEKFQTITAGKKADALDLVPLAFGSVSYYIGFISKNDLTDDTENEIFSVAYKALFDKDLNAPSSVDENELLEPFSDAEINDNENILNIIQQDSEIVGDEPDFNEDQESEEESEEETSESGHDDEAEEQEEASPEESHLILERTPVQEDEEQEELEAHASTATEHVVQTHFDENEESNTDFREESEGVFASLNEAVENIYQLLSANRKSMQDEEVLENSEDIRRHWHTFKGSAAMCGFMLFSQYAKHMEDTMSDFVDSNGSWSIDRIKWLENSLHQAVEYLESLFNKKTSLTDDILVNEEFPESEAVVEDVGSLDDIFSFDEAETVQPELEQGHHHEDESREEVDASEDTDKEQVEQSHVQTALSDEDLKESILNLQQKTSVSALDKASLQEDAVLHEAKEVETIADEVTRKETDQEEVGESEASAIPDAVIAVEQIATQVKDTHSGEQGKHTSEDLLGAIKSVVSVSQAHNVQSQKQEVWSVILEKMKLIEDTQSEVTELFVKLSKLDTMASH